MNSKEMVKISILKDGNDANIGNNFAYMEYQSGNDPKVFNDTYGNSGYWSFEEVCEAVVKTYEGMAIEVHINL